MLWFDAKDPKMWNKDIQMHGRLQLKWDDHVKCVQKASLSILIVFHVQLSRPQPIAFIALLKRPSIHQNLCHHQVNQFHSYLYSALDDVIVCVVALISLTNASLFNLLELDCRARPICMLCE